MGLNIIKSQDRYRGDVSGWELGKLSPESPGRLNNRLNSERESRLIGSAKFSRRGTDIIRPEGNAKVSASTDFVNGKRFPLC